ADSLLVDNTTYYVTQTFGSCESVALAVTVHEEDCSVLDIVSTSPSSVCGEGAVLLKAEGAGAVANTNLYWYDAASGGNVIARGNEFYTPELEETTSYWVSEVAVSGGEASTSLQSYCTPTFSTGCTASDYIDDFIIEDGSGSTVLSHLGTGCATDAYADYT